MIINTNKIKIDYEESILVPYMTTSGNGILKCIIVEKLLIDNDVVVNNVLVGISSNKIEIEGVNMLLHMDLIGGIK